MSFWTPTRITGFLSVWALVVPFKVYLHPHHLGRSYCYAALWVYLPNNPLYDSPFIVDLFAIAFFFPFYVPALAIAWFVWHSSKSEDLTRGRYIERIIMLVIVQTVLAFIIPCPSDEILCLPMPTTGFVALFFVSRIVTEIESPWRDDS